MQKKIIFLYILPKLEFLNIKNINMKKNYIKNLLKMFPDIASGRKNFEYFDSRVKKNLLLSSKYKKKSKAYVK